MPIDDLPPGEWTELLIGDQWPSASSAETMSHGANARRKTASELEHYADNLRAINSQILSAQEGFTADDARAEFERGERHLRDIASSNRVKSNSYAAVHRHIVELRRGLRELSLAGNTRIDEANASTRPINEKVAAILDIATDVRGRALIKAEACAGEINSEMHLVLAAQGIDLSPWIFAEENGIASTSAAGPGPAELGDQIARKLDQLAGPQGTGLPNNAATPVTSIPANSHSTSGPRVPSEITPPSPGELPANAQTTTQLAPPAATPAASSSLPTNGPVLPMPDLPANAPTPTLNLPAQASTSFSSGTPTAAGAPARSAGNTELATAAPFSSAPSTASNAPISTPPIDAHVPTPDQHAAVNLSNDLASTFNTGSQAGAPISATAEAISTAAAGPVHTAPPPLSNPLADAGATMHPVHETAHAAQAPTAEVAQIVSAPTEVAPPVVTAPAAAPISPIPTTAIGAGGQVSTPSPVPPGGLLGYGTDLRPPATAATSPLMPSATAPISAPVNATSGAAPTGQPAVVRQQPGQGVPQTATGAGLTERAFAATVTGAALGATSAKASANARLRGLLGAVVSQQPELRWGIGELADGTTVLVTDLDGGWIPPHIEIPTGITLLAPGERRGGLSTLLGPAIRAATYEPSQHIDETAPVSTSIRARDTTAVEDLGWELAQATRWRDGLPRLAHTLAKAVAARTGCLDSEVTVLRDCLAKVACTVLTQYPSVVDPQQVGNWQLLATIDALLNNEKTLANYHFAWFRAQVLTRKAHR